MNLILQGHDYRYAAEQMLLTLFPEERPEYPAGPLPPGGTCFHSPPCLYSLSPGHVVL